MRSRTLRTYSVSSLFVAVGLAAASAAAWAQVGAAPLTFSLLDSNLEVIDTFEVMFNPKEYVIEKSAPWQEQSNAGLDNPELQWTTGESLSLSMELLLDTSDLGVDVQPEVLRLLELVPVEREQKNPPILLLQWGSGLKFTGVIDTVSVRYTLFLEDGTPVRATASVRFTEYKSLADQLADRPHR